MKTLTQYETRTLARIAEAARSSKAHAPVAVTLASPLGGYGSKVYIHGKARGAGWGETPEAAEKAAWASVGKFW